MLIVALRGSARHPLLRPRCVLLEGLRRLDRFRWCLGRPRSRLTSRRIPPHDPAAAHPLDRTLYLHLYLSYARVLHLGQRIGVSRWDSSRRLAPHVGRGGVWLAWARRDHDAGIARARLRLRKWLGHGRRLRKVLHPIARLPVAVWLRRRILAVCVALGALRRPVVSRVHGGGIQSRRGSPEAILCVCHGWGGVVESPGLMNARRRR